MLTGQMTRDMKSTSRYCHFVGGKLLNWKSKKQSMVVQPSTEVECRSMAIIICELLWLKQLLHNMSIINPDPMKLYNDSKATIHICKNLAFHECTKYIEVGYHFLQEKVHIRIFNLEYINIKWQPIDLLIEVIGFKETPKNY